jgi:hypothetical protein
MIWVFRFKIIKIKAKANKDENKGLQGKRNNVREGV